MVERANPAVASVCECADCRRYRVWRLEGTDEWQPESDAWTGFPMMLDGDRADARMSADAGPADALSRY
jgi:hypothetical protein